MTNPTHPSSTLDVNVSRAMVRDSIFLGVEEWLDKWLSTVVEHARLFPKLSEHQGNLLLSYVRLTLVNAEKASQPAPATGRTHKYRGEIFDASGACVARKSFDTYTSAEKWVARQLAEEYGENHSGSLDGSPISYRQATLISWGGGRSSGPVMAKSSRHDGPWQKAQQTRVVLPK